MTTSTALKILGQPANGSRAWPVSGGIPFPLGLISDTRLLRVLSAKGTELRAQFEPLVRWEDGSLKAVLVTVLPAPETPARLSWDDKGHRNGIGGDGPPLRIRKGKNALEVDTGAARFTFGIRPTPCLKQIRGRGGNLLQAPLGLNVQGLNWAWYDAAGPGRCDIEAAGPYRAQLRLSGSYLLREWKQPGLKWILRAEFWAGCPYARIFHTLVDADPRSMVRLRNIGLTLRTRRRPDTYVFGGEEGTGAVHRGRRSADPAYLYQAGKPGSCDGLGYETTYAGAGQGRHAAGWVAAGGLGLGIRHFWQQFPKELLVSRDGLEAWLHTDRNGEYFWSEAPGLAKTHELLLSAEDQDFGALFSIFTAGPLLAATPEWYLNSGVFPFLAPTGPASRTFDELMDQRLPEMAWSAYGWKNFGDHTSSQTAGPAIETSFNNHHYEEPRTFFHQFLRTGDFKWFEQGVIGARHHMDIDTQHSPGPNRYAEFGSMRPNHGPGFVWMHYSHDHQGLGHVSHFHLGGLSQYYLLTGDRRALEVLRETADFTASLVEDPPPTFVCETLNRGSHERCAPQARGYWGMSRDLGWIVHLMHQAYQATGDARYPRAAAKVVRFLFKQWRTPTPHYVAGKKVGMHRSPKGCWAFYWHEGGKLYSGLNGWGSAIVLMAGVEFMRDNERLKLVPQKALLKMLHENAVYFADHVWDPAARAFRYAEHQPPRPQRYWPNSLYLFPLRAVGELTGDERLKKICAEAYQGPLGIATCAENPRFDAMIGMWQTAHYLSFEEARCAIKPDPSGVWNAQA